MTGIQIYDNTGPVRIEGPIKAHHHGLDGMTGNGPGDIDTREDVVIRGVSTPNNGRQGYSLVGGIGWEHHACKFNQTGRDLGATMIPSLPGAGVDLEAEGGRYVVGTRFYDCDAEDNYGQSVLADSSANTYDIEWNGGRLVGTTNFAGWFNRPSIVVNDATILGPLVHLYADADPLKAFRCFRTKFSNDPTLSPTGALYAPYPMDISSQITTNVYFEECRFENVTADTISFGQTPDANGVGPRFHDCSFTKPDGTGSFVNVIGVFSGDRTTFANVQSFPGQLADQPWVGANNYGIATDSFTWSYSDLGVGVTPTRYRQSWDRIRWKKVMFWSVTYDPPSLASGVADSIHTTTVTGVAVGDVMEEVTFGVNLAGARMVAWASAANTVSYYAVNENGANPLNLASGTLRGKVRKA
jgi:hypothetical protein